MALSKILPASRDQSVDAANLILNGAMAIAQRGTSHTLSAGTGSYTLDRVRSQSNGGGITVSQETNTISGIQTEKMCRYTGASGVTGVYYVYRVESKDAVQLNGNSATFSIYIENNSGASISPTIDYYHPTAIDNFSGLTTIASGVALGTIADGASARLTATTDLSGTTITNGLMFQVNFGSALTSGTIDFTGVCLNVGDQAPANYPHRSYGEELALCQRYYQQWGPSSSEAHLRAFAGSYTTGVYISNHFLWPTIMRAYPSFAIPSGPTYQNSASFGIGSISTTGVTLYSVSTGTNLIAGFYIDNNNSDYAYADAEL